MIRNKNFRALGISGDAAGWGPAGRVDGGRPTVFGDGRQTRDFVHVADVVRANLLAARSEAVGAATEEVKRGNGLGYALSQSKRFPKLALQMVAVRREAGGLDGMPIEPAADTSPKASVRRCGATTRAAMLAVIPELVQASATPIITPAPITIGSWLVAVAVRMTPTM